MKKTISFVMLALLLVGCATPVATTHLCLNVCLGHNFSKENPADSTIHHHFTKKTWGNGSTAITNNTSYTKYNERGYILRKDECHEMIFDNDTIKSYNVRQNIFNNKGELVESREFVNDTLSTISSFRYNKKGQLVEYVSQDIPEENYVPLKYRYAYDRYGNICLEERYENDELVSRDITRYNHKGQKLEVARYRSDGTLDDKTIYTYNLRGDLVETTHIFEHGRIHFMGGVNWEQNPFERDYWNEHQTPLKPIEKYDTLRYRTTYHSKGKVATKQHWDSLRGEWRTNSRIEYNSKGVPTWEMEYQAEDENFVTSLTLYNSHGLPTDRYIYDKKKDTLKVVERKVYNDQGKVILDTDYSDLLGINLRFYFYDDNGNLVDEGYYNGNGSLNWRKVTEYENGKKKRKTQYGKNGALEFIEVFTEEGDELKSSKYDKDGTLIRVTISEKSNNYYRHREYDGSGELLMEFLRREYE